MKNILLTGSGGFIGKNLKTFLKDKYAILSPRSYELDCTDTNAVKTYLEQNKTDCIIHCASIGGARGIEDKDTTIEDNLKMVSNLIEAKNDNTKIILFGSGAMYGKTRPLQKIKEEEIGKFIPEDLYGKSKMLIAQKIKERKDVICLNIFACYGYGEKESRFPTYAIKQNINHSPIEINQDVVFDYLFVEDMCKIVEYFINNNAQNNIINITPSNSIKLSQIAMQINEIGGFKSDIIFKTKTLGNEYTGNNQRLLSEIPDFKFTPYNIGLSKLYNYIISEKSS